MYLKSSVFGILAYSSLLGDVDALDKFAVISACMGAGLGDLQPVLEERLMLVDEIERRAREFGGLDIGQATKDVFKD